MPDYVTVRKAAEILGVHRQTVRKWLAAGVLPCARLKGRSRKNIRIDREDLARMFEKQKGGGGPAGAKQEVRP